MKRVVELTRTERVAARTARKMRAVSRHTPSVTDYRPKLKAVPVSVREGCICGGFRAWHTIIGDLEQDVSKLKADNANLLQALDAACESGRVLLKQLK